MIILVPGCGLCNRMRAIASAYTMAKEFKTKLVILWRLDEELNCRFERLFKPIDGVTVINYRTPKGKYNWPLIIAQKLCPPNGRFSFGKNGADYVNDMIHVIKEGKNVFATSIFSFYNFPNFNMFVPADSVQKAVDIILPPQRENLVGVHIRRTDNPWSRQNSTSDLFEYEMNKELEEDPDSVFFLATDSKSEEKYFTEKFRERVYYQKEKAFGRDYTDGMISAAIDLACLSQTKKIIGSYISSFTDTAANWGGIKPLTICDNADTTPQEWNKYVKVRND